MTENFPFRKREVVEIRDGVPIFADNAEELAIRVANGLRVESGINKSYSDMMDEDKKASKGRKKRRVKLKGS